MAADTIWVALSSARALRTPFKETLPLMMITVAALGWITAFLLVGLLLVLTQRWKTAFKTKEWVIAPSSEVRRAESRLDHLADATAGTVKCIEDILNATAESRDEFRILRTELEEKSQEIRALRLGAEFHSRRPLIIAIARAVNIMAEDSANGVPPEKTLEGINAELSDTLEETGVDIATPSVGAAFDQRGVVMSQALVQDTEEHGLVGTIASVDHPAYIYRGPAGAEDVLIPARVRVYRLREA